jgi:hypothetical protein
VRTVGRAFRRAVALGVLGAMRGRRVLLPVVGLLVVAIAGLAFIGRPTAAPSTPVGQLKPSTASVNGGASAPTSRLTTTNVAAVPSVDSYIKGLTQFDAKLMWGSLSEEAIQAMRSRGGSLEALQQGLDDAKQRGGRYEGVEMIGSYPLQDGQSYLFYVMSRRGFAGTDQLDQLYFVFTVDKTGKIVNVE